MEFEKVLPNDEQLKVLFHQLKYRAFTISHKHMPSFEEHERFVNNHPYREWFLVNQANTSLGNVYIHYNNSIGLNCGSNITPHQIEILLNKIYSSYTPLPALPSVRNGEFFLNIASSNFDLQEKLKALGFIELEKTFIRENRKWRHLEI